MDISILDPILQAGAFGLCAALISLLWWLLRHMLAAFRGNTSALISLTSVASDVLRTSRETREIVRDIQLTQRADHPRPR